VAIELGAVEKIVDLAAMTPEILQAAEAAAG